ncbi:polymer-forming cytoskeletal protein [Haloarchaeobius baliensis]|uniref:polymer-forming cytoskeletal protein n=1 Tax=Haloarchaeobius baliensis TaxID=1670458 RepID=UPI003F885C2F
MNPTELVPLLVVVVLLVSASGADPDRMTVTLQGDQTLDEIDGVHVVAGGTTTVPANASVDGDLYVIGGTARLDGTLSGDVTVLAGNVTVTERATLAGTLRTIGGRVTVADGATIGVFDRFEPPAPGGSPTRRVGTFLLQFLVLGAAGWWLARRQPTLLSNVGHAVTEHPLVCGVVGSLGALSLLVLFVYMAFTLILLPVSLVGLLGQLAVVLYAQVVFGYLVGSRLPVARTDRATFLGVGVVLFAFEVLGAFPLVGALVQLAAIGVGFGAVLNTYFGLQRFEPVSLPGVDE